MMDIIMIKKTFKCFTFSQLFGKYKIENKHLIF